MCEGIKEGFDRQVTTFTDSLWDYDLKAEEICVRFGIACKNIMAEVQELIKKADEEAKQNADTTKTKRPRGRTKKNETIRNESEISTPGPENKSVHMGLSSGKPKRMASQVASAMITQCSNEKGKLRRPSGQSEDLLAKFKLKAVEEIEVKQEKDESDALLASEQEHEREDEQNMPPPAIPIKPPKKGRPRKIKAEADSSDTDSEHPQPTRATRSKKNQKVPDSKPVRSSRRKKKGDSDVVVIPGEPIPIIEVLDSSCEESATNTTQEDETTGKENENPALEEPATKSTTKEVVKQIKIERSKDNNDDKKRQKRDSNSSEDENKRAKKRTKKGTKTVQKVEKILISIENIKQEKIVVSAPSIIKETITIPETPKPVEALKVPQTKNTMNETFIPATLNSTYCTNPMNATVTIEKGPLNPTVTIEKSPANTPTNIPKYNSKLPNIDKPDLTKQIVECSVLLNKDETRTLKPPQAPQLRISLEKNAELEKLVGEKTKTNKGDEKTKTNKGDETFACEPTTQWQKPQNQINEPLLTDDDSDISPAKEILKTPTQLTSQSESSTEKEPKATKKGIKSKPMFSPYANSPVRKRVAAFEKLGSAEKKTQLATTRVTRTKTKKLIEEKEKSEQKSKIPPPKPTTKYTTPIGNHKLKSLIPNSDLKNRTAHKQNISTMSNSTDTTYKSQSAIKLTRTEQMQKHENKEDDAQRKKAALINAKIEESKRLREEKMMRAQKAREEKEKLKEEKLRQMLADKEEKHREDAEQKKALLAWKAKEVEEQRKIVEANRIQRQKEEEEERRLQYKKYKEEKEKKYKKAPPLPTPDCYDSDSSDSSARPKVAIPKWAHKQYFLPVLEGQMLVPKEVIHKFFCVKPITPDLEEIFENIPKAYLKRNSSAVWRTPPRYSMLPKF